ncbi:hypothetical protein BTN49_0786 [Candidatus Enterovibrio escicola]|uniref:Uncharacterized protein n=1 Tax=Candidatus Enterovibrio escicola TaxID=1927127 RepID=A0A2A5T6N7_9GAMM|nr:hypothetical protein BTN49_0786 [Candidatus Enterovibrio escacola]
MVLKQVVDAIREHSRIESMHYILDLSMQEDAFQIYCENAIENLIDRKTHDLK